MKNDHDDHKHIPKRWVGCDLEEHYFGDDRKLSKAERKIAKAKDRSKYKKTDRDKAAQEEKLKNTKINEEDYAKGRVLSIVPEGIIVDSQGTTYTCTLRGSLKQERSQHKNLVTVGDFVFFEILENTHGSIVKVESRKSVLSRADNLSRRKEQLIAANIDQVLITASVVEPPLKFSLIDRYIIAAQKGNMLPIVIINKIDMLTNSEEETDPLVESQSYLLEEMRKAYTAVDIPVIAVSSFTKEGMDLLKKIMEGKASVFSGQSGVGKSSLINAVAGMDLETGEIVEKTKKGAHTTTTTKLLQLPFGGWCIDTPGIKSFGVWNLEKDEVEHYFSEIFECGIDCRYPDCTHTQEADCAVRIAVEKEQISPLRFESYLALMDSVSQEHLRR